MLAARMWMGLAALAASSRMADGRQVHVNLTTSYLASPLYPILETSEFLSQDDPALFFKYLSAVNMRHNAIKDKHDVNYTKVALEAAADVLPEDSSVSRLLPFVLQTRAHSPSIELFHQLAIESAFKGCPNETVSAWAIIYRSAGCADAVMCDVEDFDSSVLDAAAPALDDSERTCAASGQHDFYLPVDHVYPSTASVAANAPHVVVYGELTSPSFQAFHSKLLPLAVAGSIKYIVRHAPTNNTLPVLVHGYGVTLHVKNMEYKTFDDSKTSKSSSNGTSVDIDDDQDDFVVSVMMKKHDEVAQALRNYLEDFDDASAVDEFASDDVDDAKKKAPWQLTQLGYLAMQYIMASADPLKRLQLLSQNFPKYASSLVLTSKPVAAETIEAMGLVRNQVISQRLHNRIVVNGLPVDFNEYGFNAFDFLKSLSGELRLADTLAKLDPSGTIRGAVGSLSSAPADVRITLRGPVDGFAPLYLNSIETDEETEDWPTDMGILRAPTWNLIYLRKVMYELILVVDPTTKEGIEALNEVNFLRNRQAPIQFGVLWTSPQLLALSAEERAAYTPSVRDEDLATVFHVAKMFHAAKKHSKAARDKYLREVVSVNDLKVKEVLQMYSQAVGERFSNDAWLEDAKAILTDGDNDPVWAMTDLVAAKKLPINSHVFNGVVRNHVHVQEDIMSHFGRDQSLYQELVRGDKITDDADMLNELVGSEESYAVYCPWFDPRYQAPRTVPEFSWDEPAWKQVGSFHAAGTASKPKRQNVLLLANLDTATGAQSAYQALKRVPDYPDLGLTIVHTGASSNTLGHRVSYMLSQLGHTDSTTYMAVVLEVLRLMSKKPEADVLTHARLFLQLHLDAAPNDKILTKLNEWLTSTPSFSHPFSFKVDPHNHVIYVNGRPLDLAASPLSAEHFDVLVVHEASTRSKAVSKAYVAQFKHDNLSVEDAADKSLAFNLVMNAIDEYLKVRRVPSVLPEVNPLYSYETPTSQPSGLDVVAYLDPLSETAQRASGILRMLASVLHAKITLVLLPSPSYEEFPLKRFYRFLWGGSESSSVDFLRLPRKPVLTLNIEPPELWNVQMIQSDVDVDNIQDDASATFYIKDVLVYGQCVDRTIVHYPSLPNGLQLTLERSAGTVHSHKDTVVMKNLGYFQLQAAPGVWELGLAKGRHSKLYELVIQEDRATTVPVIVYDFLSSTLQLVVKKQHGQESVRLLDEDEPAHKTTGEAVEEKSYWRSLVQWGSDPPSSKRDARSGDTIHVFSLATGHLYERMLKLMMLSVMKRTKNPVTFWLLENFLSPDFKNSVGALQAEFGMDIRFITYKWPNWLRRQTEKQRIIWGYKILFLDVLFPLGVEKIIYVDADQVVRADLNELWTMDLQGRPYGYTPFCDSRNVGFQFWRTGYWKDHLRGKPYHISALYVVDLVKFKRMAAGDSLRAIYDQLSADPHSLSNLDQDLPNYAQHQIPIFSLPQVRDGAVSGRRS
ncbi:hypothetical protein, variant 1 [Aphanomyces invadans]|uniref:UDP-glucose:glycoprotein glucosyltransferase n=1 Tax=Aphanomyces invadans TaxID=157072 RepID=A0A024U5A5_9STRA|nr:hypothetical protein, variant 1 [Aphanomyces invadans]ETW01414.1 hypothetical protein, variant 1 [Aphanomyces invadans]|eukprot:XP_008870412.1 hypothetical protein, variant 1 [Aphanomyces invadans]